MRTPQQWQEAYTTMLSDEDKSVMQQWIAAIQSDAREGMVSKEQLRPTIALAVKALESSLAGVWDGHYSGKGVTVEYAQAVDREVKSAISRLESLQIGLIHATAAQRAEAFLRAIGKWTNE